MLIRPDPSNWSSGNVWNEVQDVVQRCEWFQVYDIVEAIHQRLKRSYDRIDGAAAVDLFGAQINDTLRRLGIGWQFHDGHIQARGDDAFEAVVTKARSALALAGKATAHAELRRGD